MADKIAPAADGLYTTALSVYRNTCNRDVITFSDIIPLMIGMMETARTLRDFTGLEKKAVVKEALRCLVADAVPGDKPQIESFISDAADQAIDAIYFVAVNKIKFKDMRLCKPFCNSK